MEETKEEKPTPQPRDTCQEEVQKDTLRTSSRGTLDNSSDDELDDASELLVSAMVTPRLLLFSLLITATPVHFKSHRELQPRMRTQLAKTSSTNRSCQKGIQR